MRLDLPLPPGDVVFIGAAARFNAGMRQLLGLGSGAADVVITDATSAIIVALVPDVVVFFHRRAGGGVAVHPIAITDPTTMPGRLADGWAQQAIDLLDDFLLEVRPTHTTIQ